MFNSNIYDEERIRSWADAFSKATPFRFLVLDDFLLPETAAQLASEFPPLNKMDVSYKGLNENKSEHSSFDNLHPVFHQLRTAITRNNITDVIGKITTLPGLETIDDRYGFGLHQGGRNSFLDIHVDYNLHPMKKMQRRLNLIIFLNPEWKKEWGGALEFWNWDVSACMHSILPVFNRCVLFESNNHSYHGYSRISCPESVTRKSFYLYYFSKPDQRLLFHDTIFRPTPEASLIKRPIVYTKELVKNLVKTFLYHTGLNRFLK